ncbi:hypothetical protein SS50377_23377 [Spironucleus salmonicida]|uniref:Uncharacterized protein n=1 Tax=Spironucleus salmonicida TaxID=348837 RepID=V6M219_9EUKA|nr:hypothetical protein SS50377_23377 [Spironucleus salmonicida]|eukprot:EST47249.1 Hypothetical protein SS50377_12758 [Spironucleus salmonicida]
MTSTWFSPSVYDLIWKKTKHKDNLLTNTSFYLPDTIFIEHSVIKNWYFSSIKEPAVLKRGKDSFTSDKIVDIFNQDCYPLQCCAMIIYIDLNCNSDIVYKVDYLSPPQLRSLLSNMQRIDLTCILQKVIFKLPGIIRENDEKFEPKLNFDKAIAETKYRLQIQQNQTSGQQEKDIDYKDYIHNSVSQIRYQIIKVKWEPDSITAEGRNCSILPHLYNYDCNQRFTTFFSDSSRADQFALSQTTLHMINKLFTSFIQHVFVSQKQGHKITKIIAYVQLHESTVTRYQICGQQLTFLFATSIIINKQEIDLEWSQKLLFSIRSDFNQPYFLNYKICRDVVLAFQNKTMVQSTNQIFKNIYSVALRQNNYQQKDIHSLIYQVQLDLSSENMNKVNKSYLFLETVIEQVSQDQGYIKLLEELEINDRPKHLCSRCEQVNATFKLPLKFLLSEPLYYFKNKIPQIIDNFRQLSICDIYSALNAIIFNDDSYLQFRDTMRMSLEKKQQNNQADEFTFPGDSIQLIKVFMQGDHADALQATKQFYDTISKIKQNQQKARLDLINLTKFYDMAGRNLDTIVPNKLLRNAQIITTKMGVKCFMQRLDDRNFLYHECWICDQCYQQIIQLLHSMK